MSTASLQLIPRMARAPALRQRLLLCLFSLIVLCVEWDMVSASTTTRKTVICKDKKYPRCYLHLLTCPTKCPQTCVADCIACKGVCPCTKRGSVCEDPRFVGGDGVTFYFHGKKDRDFCLVSDSNLHINAHFIGKRNDGMNRDFTWVQSVVLFFGSHQVYIGADKVTTWDDSVDHLKVRFDGATVKLPTKDGANWFGPAELASITRSSDTNSITLDIPGNLTMYARVVPITKEESQVHNYGIGDEDCFAHLELAFKFYSLTQDVDGVLGQTYQDDYKTPVKMSASMPLMGGNDKFSTSSLFTADCAVARFKGTADQTTVADTFGGAITCTGGFAGSGIVCKK